MIRYDFKNNFMTLFLFLFLLIPLSLLGDDYYFATYNLKGDSAKDNKNGDGWENRVNNLSNLILFNFFDVLGVQECNNKHLTELNKYISEVYDNYGISALDNNKKERGQCFIFYRKDRFKPISKGHFWLSETPNNISIGWEASSPRVCVWVYLEDISSHIKIWAFNLHLDHVSEKAKEQGCKLVLQKIKDMTRANDNIILTGDFNFAQNTEYYNLIKNSNYLIDSFTKAKYKWLPTGTHTYFNVKKYNNRRIDHIWVSDNINVITFGINNNFYYSLNNVAIVNSDLIDNERVVKQKLDVRLPSDHYPLSIKTKIKSK